jgi:hypothetical protein
MNPIPIHLAVQATQDLARSALPDAPTVTDPPRRPAPSGFTVRRTMARGLRWAANRIEPGIA